MARGNVISCRGPGCQVIASAFGAASMQIYVSAPATSAQLWNTAPQNWNAAAFTWN